MLRRNEARTLPGVMARENPGPPKRQLRADEPAELFARRLAKEVKQAFEEPTALSTEKVSPSEG